MSSSIDHISEVFIKPIRSVLAVDDLFPTLDDLVSKTPQHVYDVNSERLSKLLQFCRTKYPQWLFDVDNGKGMGGGPSSLASMPQCGWLILDYKLDGEAGDGSRSTAALRTLAGSNHFNLVAIYTADNADVVFRDVALALSNFPDEISITEIEKTEIESKLREWEDSEPEIDDVLQRLISPSLCFELMSNKSALVKNGKNAIILAEFNRVAEIGVSLYKIDPQILLNYFAQRRFASLNPSQAQTFAVETSSPQSDKRWIFAGNIFVFIEGKNTEPELLFDGLIAALKEWQPSPNQLIIAKIRAELEASGLILDREVVKDKYLQAFWLKRLLDAEPREKEHYVAALVDRQSEILGDRLRSKLIDFTASVVSQLNGTSVDITKLFLGIDPTNTNYRKLGLIAHNTHVSTKPPAGKNLTSGHILKLEEQTGPSYWVCLSPACDLEAGRTEGRDLKVLIQPLMPVTLLKLHPISEGNALKFATRGWVLFLELKGEKVQFSYYKSADEKSNPVWEEVFAMEEGRLLPENQVPVARIRKFRSAFDGLLAKEIIVVGETQIPLSADLPVFEEFKATVVAQLRTEYAANLTLRFTAHLARIGLDYYSE